MVGLIVWGVVVIIPKIQEQSMSFADNLPGYLTIIENKVNEILSDPIFSQVQEQIEAQWEADFFFDGYRPKPFPQHDSKSRQFLRRCNDRFSGHYHAIYLFYLLKDGLNQPYFVKFLPTKMRQPSLVVLKEMNDQVSSYIRGQLTVAFAVAVMFMIGFSIIGLDYAITLGLQRDF